MNWINIENELPKELVEVIVFEKGRFKSLDVFYLAMINEEGLWVETLDDEILKNVTHWMPLPEPPNEHNT